jgi:NitT/TauT family transport system ATP-binding protein
VKIAAAGLGKVFQAGRGAVAALDAVDLKIHEGEFVVVVGPSGCGKTTLLRILAGLDKHTSGTLAIDHADPARPLNTMVFQENAVFPWYTVRKNIGYGLRIRGVPRAEIRARVDHFLAKVGLTDFADAYPHQLSGGMKQRVSIARAFANDPEILLMDEPFAALDEQNKAILQEELMRIWEESRKTVVFITHSLDEALYLADRVVVMSARPGRIKTVLAVPFERPREVYGVRRDPRYGTLSAEIWDILRGEVLRARGEIAA